ncbi:hypothetical protein SAMN05421753_115150 [Planctomicrobium piriforme]|uniref:Uncharacterized protein n=1 Tax=Planctomicrobium piriforme TaxID=1576369 RepID=A0A1I3NN53_9PLAN|nr:hypothetical protein SAMN05421753_115150 [Planctomicrobium piriforme]
MVSATNDVFRDSMPALTDAICDPINCNFDFRKPKKKDGDLVSLCIESGKQVLIAAAG